jgi:hypothetical protein
MSWDDIKNAAAGCDLLLSASCIQLPFPGGNMLVVSDRPWGQDIDIYDVFSGKTYRTSYDKGVEYIQKLRMLPAPTLIDIPSCGVPMKRKNNYWRVSMLREDEWSVYMCNEYMFMFGDNCFKMVSLGEMVDIHGYQFPYSAEAFIKMEIRRRSIGSADDYRIEDVD